MSEEREEKISVAGSASESVELKSPDEKNSISRSSVLILCLLHLAVALPLAYVLNVWADEASTLYTTRGGFAQTFQTVFADEKQAPLYFLLLSLWRALDDSVFFARLLSIIFSLTAIVFFHRLTRRFFDERAALFAAILFALHPFLIWSSLEVRGYSLVVLLSVLLLNFFAVGYFIQDNSREQSGKRARVFFILTAIVSLYANYYAGFLLIGCFAALLAARRFGAAKTYFVQVLIVAACISPLAFIIKQQLATNTSGFAAEKTVLQGAQILWRHALTLIFPTELSPAAEISIVSITRVWLVRFGIVAAVFLIIKNKFRAVDRSIIAFGAIAATVGFFLLAAYFILGGEYVALRHAAIWFVPLALFVFAVLRAVLPARSWIFFAVVFAFLYSYSVYKSYPVLAKRGDWARVARFIEQNEKPNQPIIVFQNYDALCLPIHYAGVNKILPDERFFAWSAEDSLDSENAFRKQIEFIQSQIPPDADEIWLATEENCQREATLAACRPLENFVQANYTVVETRDFYLERVRLLRKK